MADQRVRVVAAEAASLCFIDDVGDGGNKGNSFPFQRKTGK